MLPGCHTSSTRTTLHVASEHHPVNSSETWFVNSDRFSCETHIGEARVGVSRTWHETCFYRRETHMTTINSYLHNPLFWDKKLRIAILTIATFMALC